MQLGNVSNKLLYILYKSKAQWLKYVQIVLNTLVINMCTVLVCMDKIKHVLVATLESDTSSYLKHT